MRAVCLTFCLAMALTAAQSARAEPISSVVAAQPAVFEVESFGRFDIRYPSKVSIDMASLQAAYRTYKEALPAGARAVTEAEFYWQQFIGHADQVLKATGPDTTSTAMGTHEAGTAFAVSEDGVLITNAHVITDGKGIQADILEHAPQVFDDLRRMAVEALTQQLGAVPDAQFQDATKALRVWLVRHMAIDFTTTQALVTLRYKTCKDITYQELDFLKEQKGIKDKRAPSGNFLASIVERTAECNSFHFPPFQVQARASILAKGEKWPGEDVAILKIDGFAPPYPATLPLHLVCLPLGDSDTVLPGTRVTALGFPAVAFWPEMEARARYILNVQPGVLGSQVPLKSGSVMFQMSAAIDQGDSGGPVVDDDGRAVAINVMTLKAGYTGAVPINTAKKYLEKANVHPRCGLNAEWNDALRLFYDHRYVEAHTRLAKLAARQAEAPMGGFVNEIFEGAPPNVSPFIIQLERIAATLALKQQP